MYRSLIVVVLLLSFSAHAVEKPVGFSTFNKYAKDQFVVGLFVDSATQKSNQTWPYNAQSKTLELRFVNDVGRRDFLRTLKYAIAINNSAEEVDAHWSALEQIFDALHGDFSNGDQFKIHFDGADKNLVSFNSVKLVELKSIAVFDMMLRAWIGEVPPSSPFKSALLGEDDNSSQRQLFYATQYRPERLELAKTWAASRD